MFNANSLQLEPYESDKRKIPKFGDSSSESASFMKGPADRDDTRSIVRSILFIVLLRRHTETCKRFTTEIRKRLRSIEDRVVRSIISRMQHPLSSNMRTYRSWWCKKWTSTSLEYVLGKYFDFPKRMFPQYFHPREIFSKYIRSNILRIFHPRKSHYFRIISRCVPICYARVRVCMYVCVYVYIYFLFIYIFGCRYTSMWILSVV